MSIYSFKITKGKYQLSLSTDDRDFVEEQFAVWVHSSAKYVQARKIKQHKEQVKNQIDIENTLTQKNIDEHLLRQKTKNAINEEKQRQLDTKKNLDIIYSKNNEDYSTKVTEDDEIVDTKKVNDIDLTEQKQAVFENILDNSIHNPAKDMSFKPNPTIKKDSIFVNFINSRGVERKIDYLLLTAYYFMQYEQKSRFTLKQLNSKLMQNLAIIIDHSVLQEAINRDYIECLPDLTGVVGASEYRLTAYGEKTILDN